MQVLDSIQKMSASKILPRIEQKLTDILLTSNSSTTKLLEAMTGQTMEINVMKQEILSKDKICHEYNEYVTPLEDSNNYLKRLVSLHSNGKVFSDNIVVASFDNIPEEVKARLLECKIPLGGLTGDKETKRELLWTGYLDKSSLSESIAERAFPLPKYPAKKYLIYVNGYCCFCLLEVYHIDEIARYFWN